MGSQCSAVSLVLSTATLWSGVHVTGHKNPGRLPNDDDDDDYMYIMHCSVIVGLPAITLPVALSSNQLPIGLQFIGRHYDEQRLLSAAKAVEQLVNFKPLALDFLDD